MAAHLSVDGFKRTVCGRAIGRVRVVEGETIAELADDPLERADDALEEFVRVHMPEVDCATCYERALALKELEDEGALVVEKRPDAIAGRVESAKILVPQARVITEWHETDPTGTRTLAVWRLIQAGDNDLDPRPRLTITGPTVTTTIYLPLPALDWLHKNASGIISAELRRAFQKAAS